MSEPSPNHVMVCYDVQPPVLECTRCLATEALVLPLPITKFLEVSADFEKKHIDCEEPE